MYQCTQTYSNKKSYKLSKLHSRIKLLVSSAYVYLGCSSQSYCYLLYSRRMFYRIRIPMCIAIFYSNVSYMFPTHSYFIICLFIIFTYIQNKNCISVVYFLIPKLTSQMFSHSDNLSLFSQVRTEKRNKQKTKKVSKNYSKKNSNQK